MRVDYHLHLEEGPYSLRWLDRINVALQHFVPVAAPKHSLDWLKQSQALLQERLEKGAFSPFWIDLYLEEAERKGLQEVGIVDHLYRFTEARDYYYRHVDISDSDLGRLQKEWLDQVMIESIHHFTAAIEEAKERWAKRGITLRLGLEADYFADGEEELRELLKLGNWDYVIGSVHFTEGWGFDNPDTQTRFQTQDVPALYEKHFALIEREIRSGLFDFVAHIDNMKVFNYRPDENHLLHYYEHIARVLKECDVATEINAGLYYRYPVKEMCPSPLFLSVLARHRVPITISSDSHYPDDIGSYVAQNVETLLRHGYTEVATFAKRQRIMKPLQG
ncbi:histidinol phosphate phosphatase domain-containing protein [Ectobacillus antri]|jgi:histidinol-phosphatase (PHP family)|uniref:Histidinol-phosphatase n=1 Tax=Ectobacillus antri TaxID=2486280 RepID=A0ABT6H4C5_9BACI|nr:histidinol phosphate phosphatase domain-containing protein [Ectobacillus antri]MDG4656873.1 histidinol phosphate phosphatase domain-containing protein [Ectobacillus antri]MDG5754230.1 histidinol phosphate phosphatase domain-containing protein [Ectobacillus antri]